MKTIEEMIKEYMTLGFSLNQAETFVCQEITIRKIAESPLAENVLIKGGVVMFNLTKEKRRATIDLDFDFIRYDISDSSIELFVELLNKYNSNYQIKIKSIKSLNQDDYQGKRVVTTIKDKSRSINFKLDIGVHTLLTIKQSSMCFSFGDEGVFLKVNPPEQIFSEKLYSLAKHQSLSTRYKDVYDMYYLINVVKLNKSQTKKCLNLLAAKGFYKIDSIEEICRRVESTFKDVDFIEHIKNTRDKWIDVTCEKLFDSISKFINELKGATIN